MKPLIFLNSHPIQYFAPLYQEIQSTTNIDLTVWYCSDESVKGDMDKGFGTKVKWNIPLLEGYKFEFFKNISWKPSIFNGFWGLVNPGIIKKLWRQKKAVIIIHGWGHSTHICTIVFGKLMGHTICLRAETPLNQEKLKNKFVTAFKHVYLRTVFLFVDHFLYIGHQNKLFYQSLHISERRLKFSPYAVDNKRFQDLYHSVHKTEARIRLQLNPEQKIILYSGKYIDKKRPLDLLKAFDQLKDENALLVFVGDGELRKEMESFITENNLTNNVVLTGFINQNEIPLYYRAADVFVMCSGVGETWGLSVNEALNFGLPVIVSDICGCGDDLVVDKKNGSVFKTGNINELSHNLQYYLDISSEQKKAIADASFAKINEYSFSQIIAGLEKLVSQTGV